MPPKPSRRRFRQETVIHSYITRPLALEIVRLLWHSSVTANQITIFRIGLNILSLLLFASGAAWAIVTGFLLFQIHELLDAVDGMYARFKDQRSAFGVWLEQFFDGIFSDFNGLMGVAMTIGAYRITGETHYWWWLLASLVGAKLYLQFAHLFGRSATEGGADHKEYGQSYYPILGVGLGQGLRNLYITVLTWQNQLALWGLLLLPWLHTCCDLYLYALILITLLNQAAWIYFGLLGLQKAITA